MAILPLVRASEIAYRRLREDIIQWRLEPGTPMGEIETAARLGISRTPVREAFSRLIAEGLLSADFGRTVVVSPISVDHVRKLFEYREALEAQAARLAAQRPNREAFTALAEEFRAGPDPAAPVDPEKPYFLSERLDATIDATIDNPFLVGAMRDLRGQLARLRRNAHENPARLAKATDEHLLIIEAIRDGDVMLAASATSVHLRNSLENILLLTLPLLDRNLPESASAATGS